MLGLAACGSDDDDGGGGGGGGSAARRARRSRPAWSRTSAASTTARFNALANKGRLERAEGAGRRDPGGDLQAERRLHPQPDGAGAAAVRHHRLERLPDGRRHQHRRAASCRTRTSRSSTTRPRPSRASPRTSRGCCSRSRRAATSSAIWPGCGPRTTTPRPCPPSGARRSRRWTTTSRASRPGPRRRIPGIETLSGYSQDFVDQGKCKEIALDQIAKGSKVVFQVAGQCGLGALDAAKQEGVQGIGVDADQAYLGDHILTSALKKVDEAVFGAIKRAQDGTFKGGTDVIATVENGGVGHRQDQRRGPEVRGPGQEDPGPDRLRRDQEHPRHGRVAFRRGAPGSARPRAPRNHEEVRPGRGERPGRLRPAAGRGPRAAGRERRRQVDPDVDPLRALPPRRGRDPRGRRAGDDRLAGAGDRAGDRHGPPALHARAGDDRDREHRAGRRAARGGGLLDTPRGGAARARAVRPLRPGRRPRRR